MGVKAGGDGTRHAPVAPQTALETEVERDPIKIGQKAARDAFPGMPERS